MLRDLVKKNRSYRRFYEDVPLKKEDLLALINLARFTPSAANKQAIFYAAITEPKTNGLIFEQLHWAGYLADWAGPPKGERPTGYIVMVQREMPQLGSPFDVGIAAQTILLGAAEKGFGGCIILSADKENIKNILQLPSDAQVLLVIALGKPKEKVVLDEMEKGAKDIKYYRDKNTVHHVPKRCLEDILL